MPPKKKAGKRAKVNRPHSSQRGNNQPAPNADADADEVAMEEDDEGDEGKDEEDEGKSWIQQIL